MTAAARIEGLRIHYRACDAPAPRTPLTLELEEGSSTLLIGPSGCGKSSISLTLDGLVPHSIPSGYSGSVLVDGAEVADADISALARNVALVMQDPDSQIVTRRVWDEVAYALENLCMAREEIDERVSSALRFLRIEELAARDPWSLSGGQRQRVVLAGALAQRPRLLVLDEPSANLDPKATRDLHSALADIVEAGTTLLIIEHNLDELAHRVHRVVALDHEGAIIARGTPHEVFSLEARTLQAAGIRLPAATRLGLLLGEAHPPLGPDQAEEMLTRLAPSLPPAPADAPETASPNAGPCEDDPLLEARGLGFSRTKTPILNSIDLRIAKGEAVALIGANGAGKTTLLRLLAGLEAPSSGTILRAGREGPARRRPSHSNCTLVTQNPEHQFVTSSVRDELAHGMRLAKTPRAEIERTVERMLGDYGLLSVAERNPFTLSGGQKRRLSVAAALSSSRELLLLDEPTFGQDGRSVRTLMEHVRDFTARKGAVLFTTHDLEIASTYADRVIVLAGGSIGAQGPSHRILSDDELLDSLGLLATPLTRIAAQARLAGAAVPRWSSWSEVPVLEGAVH